MTEYWFDSNFFIVPHQTGHISILKRLFAELRSTHIFLITNLVRNEISFFNDPIRLFFKTSTIDFSPEFKSFCDQVRFCLKNSKARDQPADQSLAYAAALSKNQCYIVTNDEGFKKAKRILNNIMENVEIIEPMEFIERTIAEISNKDLQDELENLIIQFANHFIKHRLRDPHNPRPIEDILQNLLLYTTISASKITIPTLSEDLNLLLRKFMANEQIEQEELQRIELVKKYFLPFAKLNASKCEEERNILTSLLYIQIPELLLELKQLSQDSSEEILQYSEGMEELIERELVRIRIEETIHYFQDCMFEDAYLHFMPVIESNWCFPLNPRTKQDLKLLYGIFQLNFGKFEYLRDLIKTNFWSMESDIKQIFELLLNINDGSCSSYINQANDEELTILYNLGLFFSNSGNLLGLKIFNTLSELSTDLFKKLNWHNEFFKRFILELRINGQDIKPDLREKLLTFLSEKDLEDNTSRNFDRNLEISQFMPIEEAPLIYKQDFYFMRSTDYGDYWKAYCWNDSIRSIVIILIPKSIRTNFKNLNSIALLRGNIRTKKPDLKEKRNVRIIIEVEPSSILTFKTFQLKIFEDI